MSQITTGLRSALSSPLIYDGFQNLMGAKRIRQELVTERIRPFNGCRILDIGCGTARILDYLPKVDYHGFDLSQSYIEEAKSRYGNRGRFTCALVEQTTVNNMALFDVVLAIGVLHHLNDEQANSLIKLAKSALKLGGRIITIDPCFADEQNIISRYLVSKDRGQNVRTASEYSGLASHTFNRIYGSVKHRTWIPYTHYIMECIK